VKKKNAKPTASELSVLALLCNLIPPHLASKLARETGVDSMARSFSPWSHVVCMLFAQLTTPSMNRSIINVLFGAFGSV
jgi:hypothetical protein